MKKPIVSVCCFLALLLVASLETQAQPHRVGGPCTYDDVPAVFTVVSVKPVPPSEAFGSPPYRPYRTLFTFKTKRRAPDVAHLLGRAHPLVLTSGADPGPDFLKRYGIRPGVRFKGSVRVIRSGTCTPFLFHLDGVDTSDLFEYRR
ncbi:hypothetical protein JCM15519_05660 [Fundidesulfovibrio butyratiphilus]